MIISLLLLQHNFHDFSVEFVLCFKDILAFYFLHVFAIELTLQENLVKTGVFRRIIVSIEQTICWQR